MISTGYDATPLTDHAPPADGNYFVSAYPPFSCWRADEVDQALERLSQPPAEPPSSLGLYVHLPFCSHRCDYCYYLSFAGQSRDQMDQYLATIVRELDCYAARPAVAARPLDFVYFGGGTPSLLSAVQLGRLLGAMQRILPWNKAREISFECAPKTVTPDRLDVLRAAGVTRISLGVQQLDDDVLRLSGRIHLVRDVERAYALIRQSGFEQVNLDLIVGLLGQTEASFLTGLERVVHMGPESVTIYQLEMPHNTPLYRQWSGGTLSGPPPVWEEKRAWLARGFRRLLAAGYRLRSAYTAVCDPNRDRFIYQDAQYHGADLVGLGASSFSYLGGVHYQNTASMARYMESVAAGRLPLARAHVLDAHEQMVRQFVLQLKLGAVPRGEFRDRFGVDPLDEFRQGIDELVARGWMLVDHDAVRLSFAGLLRADHLLPVFYLPRHRSAPYW